MSAPRVVCLLWDAAAAVMAEHFLAEGSLPALAKLAARGTRFAARPAWPCAQTPPGMATLLTGAPTHVHGVFGYREASRKGSVLDTETGFDARRLRAEPLWTTAARSGRSVSVAFAPFASPHEVYLEGGAWGPRSKGEREVRALDGYGAALAGQAAVRGRELAPGEAPPLPEGVVVEDARGFVWPLALGDGRELALSIGVGRRGSVSFDTAWVVVRGLQESKSTALDARGSPSFLRLGPEVGATLCLFDVAADGSDFLLWRGGIWKMRAPGEGRAARALDAMGPFLGGGASGAYREGLLGPSCREGGTGEAERRFLTSLEASSRAFLRGSIHALQNDDAAVTFLYEPCIDETAHVFQDLAQAALEGETGAAAVGLDALRAAYRLADDHLAAVIDLVGDDAIVAVASDHGQEPVRSIFRPNVVLREAGFLVVDDSGKIDLARTRALYGPAGNGYLLVNAADRPGGIVPRDQAARVARDACAALLSWRDASGASPIERALAAGEETPLGRVPGVEAGDAFLIHGPFVALGTNPVLAATEPASGGQHTQASDSPALDALFVVAGPGVPALGRVAERVSNLDVAPTLARLAGLRAPRDSIGRVLIS